LIERYDAYNFFDFSVPVGSYGDSFDRFLIRIEEMRESLNILEQAVNILAYLGAIGDNSFIVDDFKIAPPPKSLMKRSMEALIHHFKLFTEGFYVAASDTYAVVEAPKGEFGAYVISRGSNRPYRCRIKSPGFLHLQGLDFLSNGLFISDAVTIIGTQDLVFGEIDR
jgi:NADH:ubiquinone oxidoreductase subunit D